MHQADGASQPGHSRQHLRIHAAAADIIDDIRASGDGGLGHGGAVRVDADEHVSGGELFADHADGGHDAGDLFFGRDLGRARRRGLSADVDHGGAGVEEGLDGGFESRGGRGVVLPAVGKGVGRHVEDGHYVRLARGVERLDGRVAVGGERGHGGDGGG